MAQPFSGADKLSAAPGDVSGWEYKGDAAVIGTLCYEGKKVITDNVKKSSRDVKDSVQRRIKTSL